MAPMVDLVGRLKAVRRSGKGWTARCPAHDDEQNSLSVHHRGGKWLLKCHAGCTFDAVVAAVGLTVDQLFDDDGGRGSSTPRRNRATAQPRGLTLDRYAAAKVLPVGFLRQCGLSDVHYADGPALRISYLGPNGEEVAVRFRIAMEGDRFR
jgi:putative DNA primase/helicase